MNALVMYDHQTDTLWSQFLSRGVKGPLADTQLDIVPALQTTWEQWLSLHPETLVLDKKGRFLSDSYEGYYRSGSAGILGESNEDERLPRKDLVMGIVLEGSAKAYPLRSIVSPKVINDSLSGRELVVTFDPTSETGAIFDRTVDGRTLTFEPKADAGDGLLMIRDRETGSVWLELTGQAISGPMVGTALKGMPSHLSFWFAWSDFHPDTELYGADSQVG